MSTEKIHSIITDRAIKSSPVFGWMVGIHGEYVPLFLIEDYDLLMAMSNDIRDMDSAPLDYIQKLRGQLKYVAQKQGKNQGSHQDLDKPSKPSKPSKLGRIKEELAQLFNDNQVREAVLVDGDNRGIMTPIPGYSKFRLFYCNEAGETAELVATLDECVEVFVRRFS